METVMKAVLLGAIRAYQLTFSYVLGRQCRFMPTCSAYAAEAISRHGAGPGGRLALRRFCKCHPFSRQHGYDPVPECLPPAAHKTSHRTAKSNWTTGRSAL